MEYTATTAKNLAQIVEIATAVVRVRVDTIGHPFWNSADGRYWEGNDQVGHDKLTEVSVTIEESLLGEAPVSPLLLTVQGDARIRFEGTDKPPYFQRSGGFVEGASHILAIGEREFYFEDGARVLWTAIGRHEANWRLDGKTAVNSDARRWSGLSFDQLRLLIARAREGKA